MKTHHLIINSRYEVMASLNLVKDLQLQQETRLEPRIMQLLCLLLEKKGELLPRSWLVKAIWDNYGGGDEGLTHAISALRKVLNDQDRQIIETIPKMGYRLSAEISGSPKPATTKRLGLLIAVAVLLLLAGLLLLEKLTAKNDQVAAVPFSQINQKDTANYLNTVTTVGPQHQQYKLISIGDERPQFYINGKLLSPDSMEKHLPLIRAMKMILAQRRTVALKHP
jgi:DNA-binding winged helix-turn-helix (wHTH) protein